MRRGIRRDTGLSGMALLTALLVSCGFSLAACGSGGARPAGDVGASTPAASSAAGATGGGDLSMVVVGDSIPFNSPQDCPGCTGFVQRYATAVSKATGRTVNVDNLSQHNGLTLPMLLDELDSFRPKLAAADVIVVAVAHNSNELNADTPCGAPLGPGDQPDWTRMTDTCAAASAQSHRERYERLYTQIAAWRAGKPTILRTIDRYDDWRGAPDSTLTPSQLAAVATFITTWNRMLCAAATKASFVCVDVHQAFNGPDGTRPSGDLLGRDYTHPSDKGNAVIAQALDQAGFAPLA